MTDPNRSLGDIASIVDQAMEMAQRINEGGGVDPVEVTACDDGILVTAAPPGTITIEITNPRALQRGSDEIGEELTRSVNEALTRLREAMANAVAVNPSDMAEEFTRISDQARISFSRLLDSVTGYQQPGAR